MGFREGVRLGVDVGTVRVGVSICDPAGSLATPLMTLPRRWRPTPSALPADGGDDIDELVAAATARAARELIVGLPKTLAGNEGLSAQAVRQYADELARRAAPVVVRLVDERLTTVDAHRALGESGVSGRKRRHMVDEMSAVLILQSALDYERSVHKPPGEVAGRMGRKPRKPNNAAKSGTTTEGQR